ncbi:hypothetical protein K458DRAFT_306646 [Lentithecium fluviatile CBS 122367]|uniref:NTF2-like protein n=1 Tax=Lentithecium fluviatile CBS 122367 TaxID=1168545 RepID=A0A6G1IWI3_9PLEO|nr:hypothetical protein K458DRAFT_306646 [Lentithecium fluviatile CBS 122367]
MSVATSTLASDTATPPPSQPSHSHTHTHTQPQPSASSQNPTQSQPQPQSISPHLTLQPPLSRRGHGPGLILVVDHYAALSASEKSLDPPPLVKWAEEGFAVVQVMVPGKVGDGEGADGGEFPLERAVEVLRECEGCDFKEGGGVGLISYLTRLPFYIEEAICLSPHISAIISYGSPRPLSSISTSLSTASSDTSTKSLPPQLLHIAGPEEKQRRTSAPLVPDPESSSADQKPPQGPVKTYRYPTAKKDSAWILPADESYHAPSASLAHTRSLSFLKPLLHGPYFDLEAIWDEHCRYEFADRSVAKTMATMVAQPYVNHIPTMTGGIGQAALAAFYRDHFIFANPEDTAMELVSRTVGVDRIVDEFVFSLTHDRQVDWLLPGVPPTGKFLSIPFTSVVGLRGDRLAHEHIHWDQGTALRQVGLLPEWVEWVQPQLQRGEEGDADAAGKRREVRLPVVGAEGAAKLVDEGVGESNGLMGEGWGVREV